MAARLGGRREASALLPTANGLARLILAVVFTKASPGLGLGCVIAHVGLPDQDFTPI